MQWFRVSHADQLDKNCREWERFTSRHKQQIPITDSFPDHEHPGPDSVQILIPLFPLQHGLVINTAGSFFCGKWHAIACTDDHSPRGKSVLLTLLHILLLLRLPVEPWQTWSQLEGKITKEIKFLWNVKGKGKERESWHGYGYRSSSMKDFFKSGA